MTTTSCQSCPLRQKHFFRALTEAQVRFIAGWKKEHRSVMARRNIFEAGQVGAPLCTLYEGWAFSYVQLPDRVRQIVNILLPGDVIGLGAWLTGKAAYSVQALTPASLCVLDGRSPQDLYTHEPELALALLRQAMRIKRRNVLWLTRLGRTDALRRTAYLMLETFDRLRERGMADGTTCAFPLQFQHLGDALGLSRAHLARTLQELRERNWAAIEANTLVIHDREALARLCGYAPEAAESDLVII